MHLFFSKKLTNLSFSIVDDSNNQIQLSKTRYVTVSEFRNKVRVDIREFYINNEGKPCPGKKGVSLSLEDWKKLTDNIDKIDKIVKRLNGDVDEKDVVDDSSSSDSE